MFTVNQESLFIRSLYTEQSGFETRGDASELKECWFKAPLLWLHFPEPKASELRFIMDHAAD